MFNKSYKLSFSVFILVFFLLGSLPSLAALASPARGSSSITIVKDAEPDSDANFTFVTNALVFSFKWGDTGNGNGQFSYPQSMAVDGAGNLYVADAANDRIQVFDSDGGYLTKWGGNGSGNGQFLGVTGVAVDGNDNVYATDLNNNRVQVFDSGGSYLYQWGSMGGGAGQFDGTGEVDVDTAGNIYVVEHYNNRVQVFDSSGTFLRMWGWGVDTGSAAFEICTPSTLPCQSGIAGSGNGQFDFPLTMDIDISGNVYVGDYVNNRIQVFDSSGNYLSQWGSAGSGAGQFDGPKGVEVAANGNVYVVEQLNNRVQVFDSNGAFLQMWGWGVDSGAAAFEVCTSFSLPCQAGTVGLGDGQFWWPYDVTFGLDGTIYVTDNPNNRIEAFSGGAFVLDDAVPDDGDVITDTIKFEMLPSGAFTFTETYAEDWEVTNLACDSGSWSADLPNATLMVALGAADNITCTFTNSMAVDEDSLAFIPLVRKQ